MCKCICKFRIGLRDAFLLSLTLFILIDIKASDIYIGSATKIITPILGSWQQGSGAVKKGTRIHSELEANSVYFFNGEVKLLIISCDVGGLGYGFEIELRESIGVAAGISPRNVIITATHAHGGPSVLKHNYIMPIDTQYMVNLKGILVDLAVESVKTKQPGKIGWGTGSVLIGNNRRYTWADGSHTMGGNSSRDDFTGMEGPVDPEHTVIFAKDLSGKILTILFNNTTHMSTFYGKGVFSSGFVGSVRKRLRNQFNKNIPILFLNGAQGDILDIRNPLEKDHIYNKLSDDDRIDRTATLVMEETMRIYDSGLKFERNPVFKHVFHDLKIGVRLPGTERLLNSRKILSRIDSGEYIRGMDMIMAYGTVRLQEKYGDNPFEILPIHAIRLGGLGILTQPCELYCQFGIDIKNRSPASETIVVGLADGYHGYCPTIYGILGGGYTGTSILWTKLEPYAGYKIVETASQLLHDLWSNE